jgi:diguanylate cyclase (GGDEF)-like protein
LGKAALKFVQNASAEGRYLINLSTLSATDPLTGVANRRGFDEAMQLEMDRADTTNCGLALILLDIDHFKSINDLYGHPTGDAVLKRLGDILRAEVRETDLVARVGGEEFAVICGATQETGAIRLAERIRLAVEHDALKVEGQLLRVTVSLGVASRTASNQLVASELYSLADQRLYSAKRAGRNRVATRS